MNEKMFEGLRKAAPEKRYHSFLTTVVDQETVWMIVSEGEGVLFLEQDGKEYLPIWPGKEFCAFLETGENHAVSMEVHDFLEQCSAMEEDITFMVFPTEKDAYIADKQTLCEALQEYLDEVE